MDSTLDSDFDSESISESESYSLVKTKQHRYDRKAFNKEYKEACDSVTGEEERYLHDSTAFNYGKSTLFSMDKKAFEDTPDNNKNIEWKRPHDIVNLMWEKLIEKKPDECEGKEPPKPLFRVVDEESGKYSRFSVLQGYLGNCWFLSAVSALATNEQLFNRVVPLGQSFDKPNYKGVFRFVFWHDGKWNQEIIDDRLPTIGGELIFARIKNYEFWSVLLEKAYAQLHGGYPKVDAGMSNEAWTALTGGVCERIKPPDPVGEESLNELAIFHEYLLRSYERGALMSCSYDSPKEAPKDPEKQRLWQASIDRRGAGIESDHEYTITRIARIITTQKDTTKEVTVELVRLRNPHGSVQWEGKWSPGDEASWKTVPPAQRDRYNKNKDDGEFWMPIDKFRNTFDIVEVCHLTPDALGKRILCLVSWDRWQSRAIRGTLKYDPKATAHNRHYKITLEKEDRFGERGQCTVLISLTVDRSRTISGPIPIAFGFHLHDLKWVKGSKTPIPGHEENDDYFIGGPRHITKRYSLPPGDYCIVPGNKPRTRVLATPLETKFLLRILTEREIATPESCDFQLEIDRENNSEEGVQPES